MSCWNRPKSYSKIMSSRYSAVSPDRHNRKNYPDNHSLYWQRMVELLWKMLPEAKREIDLLKEYGTIPKSESLQRMIYTLWDIYVEAQLERNHPSNGDTMEFCKEAATKQMNQITEALSKGKDLPANTMKQMKDCRKATAKLYGKELFKVYLTKLKMEHSKIATKIPSFLTECFEICWLMAVQDPPVVFGPNVRRNSAFNKDHYKAYTKGGSRLAYVVWPVLLLHQDGPVLCKGVAQCY